MAGPMFASIILNKIRQTIPHTDAYVLIGIAVDPITNKVYVLNQGSSIFRTLLLPGVSVINGSTNKPFANISLLSSSPQSIAVNPTTNMIYVTHTYGSVDVINGTNNEIITTIPFIANSSQFLNQVWPSNSETKLKPLFQYVQIIQGDSFKQPERRLGWE